MSARVDTTKACRQNHMVLFKCVSYNRKQESSNIHTLKWTQIVVSQWYTCKSGLILTQTFVRDTFNILNLL